jgi:hypothetical protein
VEAKTAGAAADAGNEEVPLQSRTGAGLVGCTVSVYWPKEGEWFEGLVKSFDGVKHKGM